MEFLKKRRLKTQGYQKLELGQSMSLIMREAFRYMEKRYPTYSINNMLVTAGVIVSGPVATRIGYTQKTHTGLSELPQEEWKSRNYYVDIEYVTEEGCIAELHTKGQLFNRADIWEVYKFPDKRHQ